MSDKNANGQESSDRYECPLNGCSHVSGSKQGFGAHFGQIHDNDVKQRACVEEIQRLADELGRTPRTKDMAERGVFSEAIYKRLFGSWNDALADAGFEVNHELNISDEDLLEELQRLSDELDRTPRRVDMIKHGNYDATTYQDRFGTWNAAVDNIDLEPNQVPNIPDEDLLAELQRLDDELDHTPRMCDMTEYGVYSGVVYINRFGSWNAALQTAGLGSNKMLHIPEDDLLDEIRHLNDELNRTPRARDMAEHGDHSTRTYQRVFGSWNAAVEAAGLEPLTYDDWIVSGEEHPNYNGGKTNPYGAGWNESKREQVRERDDRTCQNCGRSEEEHVELFGMKHAVHHIQKARSVDDPEVRNHPDNLVTLCHTKTCHWKWESISPLRPQTE